MKNREVLKRVAAGAVTGLINGVFGAGGGMIAVLALERLCGFDAPRAHATAIAIILPLTLVSGFIYAAGGAFDAQALIFSAPAVIAGGILGAKLTGRFSSKWLNRIFALMMLASALWLIVS